MATAHGYTETMPNGDRFLVLDRGRRYEGTAGTAEYRVMEFDRYAVRIETKEARGFADSPRSRPVWELLRDPKPANMAELLWRLGIPLAALNLAYWQFPCRSSIPRAGRANNFLFALFAYMIYSNLLSVSQAWVAQGKLASGSGSGPSTQACSAAASCSSIDGRIPSRGAGSGGAENLRAPPGARDLCIHRAGAAGLPDAVCFFDLIHQLESVGRGGYKIQHALGYVTLTLPGRLYELFPICVLIGTLYALTVLARHSEITVLRAAGLSTLDLLLALGKIGLVFAVMTLLVGEFLAPPAERAAQQLRLKAMGKLVAQEFRSGLWVRDERSFVNVREVRPDASLLSVRVFEFDDRFQLRSISQAERGRYVGSGTWALDGVVRTVFSG
jgi:lipopolysaccharide export LptBFGC system permease protein LptF